MKLLIELPTWMGDSVMATPAIENVLRYYNRPKVTLIGSFISTELLKKSLNEEQAIVLNKKSFNLYKTAKNLGEFDVFISFRSSFRSKLIKLFVTSKNKYQFDKKKYTEGHVVEKYNNFINDSLGVNSFPGKLLLQADKKSICRKNKKIVGINPGASYGSAKRWYPEDFAYVATNLSSQYDIIIFGGKEEIDIAADIERHLIENSVRNYQNLVAKTSISELISQIASLDLFITGDSGPMHLAAAFQVPTVAIFGPTNHKETSQWMNKKSIIIKKDLECQPCMKRTCPLYHHNCMKLIDASEVLKAAQSFNLTSNAISIK